MADSNSPRLTSPPLLAPPEPSSHSRQPSTASSNRGSRASMASVSTAVSSSAPVSPRISSSPTTSVSPRLRQQQATPPLHSPPHSPRLPSSPLQHRRVRGPHTIVLGMDANNHSLHDAEDKWAAAPSSDPLPFSPYHLSQLENEKNTQLLLSQPLNGSPYLDPSSPAPAYAPLHRPSVSRSHHHHRQQQQQQQPGVTNTFFPAGYVSTRPHPSDIEMHDARYAQYDQPRRYHHSHAQRYPTSRSNADPSSSSSRPHHQNPNHGHVQGQGRGRTKSKRHSAGSGESRARFSESSSRTRVSAHREGHDTLAGTPRVREGNSRSRTRHHHSHQYYPHPPPSPPLPQLPTPAPTPSSTTASATATATTSSRRKGIFSYFKNPVFSVFGNSENSNNSTANQELHHPTDQHRLSWKGHGHSRQQSQGAETPIAGSRASSIHSQQKPQQSRRASQQYRQQYYQQRQARKQKTGYPGRNGEEPETDPFQFLNIMMDMPRNPSWRQVFTKLCTALAILTTSYFALMALYFSAEVQTKTCRNGGDRVCMFSFLL